MASIFKRTQKPDAPWWIAFLEPMTGEPIRKSLGTPDERLAEDMRACVEARTKLQRLQHIALPAEIMDLLGGSSINGSAAPTGSGRTPIEAVLKSYILHMSPINDSHHFADKISKFRQFFGSAIVDPLNPKKSKIVRKKPLPPIPPYFKGKYLEQLTSAVAVQFLEPDEGTTDERAILRRTFSTNTKRHYCEVLRGFFQHALETGIYAPANPHAPNPMNTLPCYIDRDSAITALSEEQQALQSKAAAHHVSVHAGVKIMIESGLRLHEALSLTRSSLSADLSSMRLIRPPRTIKGTTTKMKTGDRPITVIQPLRDFLLLYLPTLTSEYLIPSPSGGKWNEHDYAEALREINRPAGIEWTTQAFRRTFATRRITEGWPLTTLATEMGTSVLMLERNYAAYISPVGLAFLRAQKNATQAHT